MADAAVYEGLVEQLEYKGFPNLAAMVTILLPMNASQLKVFAKDLTHPVLVDTIDAGIADRYKANKDTVILIDSAGYIRDRWPVLQVRGAAGDKVPLATRLAQLASEATGK